MVRYAIEAQDKIIKKISDSGSCVIVGRAGSYVLKDYKNVIKIFVKAPKEFRIKRVMEVYNDTEKDAKNILENLIKHVLHIINIFLIESGEMLKITI